MSGRCRACNEILTPNEGRRKSLITKEEFSLCNNCLEPILPDIVESIDIEDSIWDEIDVFDIFGEPEDDEFNDQSEGESDESPISKT